MADPVRMRFRRFVASSRKRAPLYSRISAALADWPGLEELLADAPDPARVPVNLFAAVHYLLLADPAEPLARFYPNLAGGRADTGDPAPEFLAFCADHSAEVRELVATRLPQTNEVGRASVLVAALGELPRGPRAHLDIGASAGLNLMLDRLAYSDGHGVLGGSDLVLECTVRPEGRRLAGELPVITSRLGLDANPLDLTNSEDARWLEACVWPDQADRFVRLRRAIELFVADPAPLRRGDAVADLRSAVAALGPGIPVATTTWMLCYLDAGAQREFAAVLAGIGAERDLDWVWAESPSVVDVLPLPDALVGSDPTLLGYSSWRDGRRTDRVLAQCHPHGYWLTWW
ncbi:MAG: hypothetical protein CVT65_17770 [Actinobacteria bacterium HGW-Actinobacteria-5]|nr:MAG: hypothetical protein CVT65_17770 [Actinobacteria bacterium HGW-Actinobacteria-5]